MKVGLIDCDHFANKNWGSHTFPNLALCKIATWHKQKGDSVEWYDPMFSGHMDKVYISRVFNFTPEYDYPIDADEIERGGTGYNVTKCLPQEIDDCQPDISIYEDVPQDTSYGFLTRGCPNKCKWCVVPKKEGIIRPYWDVERVANGKKKLVLMDNNIIAAGDFAKEQLQKIIDNGYQVDFNQALDARLITDDFARLLAQVRWLDRRIRLGCDTRGQVKECQRAIDLIASHGYKGEFFLYTMLSDDFNECFERVSYWRDYTIRARKEHLPQAYPYAQPYLDPINPAKQPPKWQQDMKRWTNMKAVFITTPFGDYEPRKGFRCKTYIEQFNIESNESKR